LELVNSLPLIPERFFEEEREALARGRKLWDDLIDRFSLSRLPGQGPPSPVELGQRLSQEDGDSLATASLVEGLHRRLVFLRVKEPRVWADYLSSNRLQGVDESDLERHSSKSSQSLMQNSAPS
jgi:hypothetical protein